MWKIKQKDKKAKIVMKWSWVTIVTITKAYYLKYSKSEEEKTMGYIPAKFAALSCGFQLDWNWGSYSFPNFSSLGRLLCIEDIAELPKFLLIAKPGWPDGQSEVRCGPPETNGRFLRIEIPSGHIQIFGSPHPKVQFSANYFDIWDIMKKNHARNKSEDQD